MTQPEQKVERMIDANAVGLKLYRIAARDRLIASEGVMFDSGRAGVVTVLMRARVAGRVEVEGELDKHFADVLDSNEDILQSVALDAKSYRALKYHWMRCKCEIE